ncbi:MAG: hypothetical protein EOO09_11090 [Chitinophagaceae bacterium]|nr:MAG: hypothetical protein EOO09_11090 [Chitinophagaceae bacterium]
METIETRKRIEYRPALSVVRTSATKNLIPVREIPDIRTQPKKEVAKHVLIPVDHKGYIKCKNHDFF